MNKNILLFFMLLWNIIGAFVIMYWWDKKKENGISTITIGDILLLCAFMLDYVLLTVYFSLCKLFLHKESKMIKFLLIKIKI